MSLWDTLSKFLNANIGPAPKAPVPRPTPNAPRPSQQSLKHLDAAVGPKVTYKKERTGPRLRTQAWRPPASLRKQVLVSLAGVSVLAMMVIGAARLTVNKRLPSDLTGLWRTNAPAYRGRIVELRPRYVAFLVDTTGRVTTYRIVRVRQTPDRDGVLYRVQFADSIGRHEFAFVFDKGPPERLLFANQRQLAWRRERTDRSLIMQ